MKELVLFIVFFILMIGTNGFLDWLYGVKDPWQPMLSTIAVMRPSEYVVIAGMTVAVFVAALRKQLGRIFSKLFRLWVRFVEVPDPATAPVEEGAARKQQGDNHNK
ncbi:hypothetical protein ACE3NQ_14040 [Paenibacillus terreus]|uniref:Uncharacterized protein n=1 Tax=Paenibacillus terreus TaxID=1387834 RepID=A0ABV5B8L8_9BACL